MCGGESQSYPVPMVNPGRTPSYSLSFSLPEGEDTSPHTPVGWEGRRDSREGPGGCQKVHHRAEAPELGEALSVGKGMGTVGMGEGGPRSPPPPPPSLSSLQRAACWLGGEGPARVHGRGEGGRAGSFYGFRLHHHRSSGGGGRRGGKLTKTRRGPPGDLVRVPPRAPGGWRSGASP